MTVRVLLSVLACTIGALWAQDPPVPAADRVLTFSSIQAPPERQELAYAVGALAPVRIASIDNSAGTLTVNGNPEQLNAAQWLFTQLDQSLGAGSGAVAYPGEAASDNTLHVIFLTQSSTPPTAQEIVYAIRVTADVQAAVQFPPRKAIAMRGSAAQGDLAAWLVQELDVPPGGAQDTRNEHWYGEPNTGDHLVRVFYFDGATTPEQLQDAANRIRAGAGTARIAMATTARAIAVRGTLEQVTAAARIAQARDGAPVR
jgi:hypothetical protein